MKDKTKKKREVTAEETPKLTDKEALRVKLKATIEANRIARLKRDDQDDTIDDYKMKKRKAKGLQRERLKIMIQVIEDKQKQADEAWENMTYAEYGGGFEGGGCGGNEGNGAG
jgi:hypothetical protein